MPIDEPEYLIRVDGVELMSGDESSLRVVFNNLIGANFANPPAWLQGSYEDYLANMRMMLDEALDTGTEICLESMDGVTVSHTLLVDPQGHTRNGIIASLAVQGLSHG